VRTQLLAVAWLRWRIFVNSTFRRRGTGRAAGLVLAILVRITVWPFLALMVIGPVGGSGFLAWAAIANNHPQRLASLLAGIMLLWLFVNINGQSVTAAISSFDPSSLIRFPLRFGRYLTLRIFIGLLTPSTIVGCRLCWPRRLESVWPTPRWRCPPSWFSRFMRWRTFF